MRKAWQHLFVVSILSGFLFFISCENKSVPDTIETSNSNQDNSAPIPKNPNKNAYFGDLHLHTSWSFDAFIYNNRTTPDDAYRYGKGEAIDFAAGGKIQNQYPLDFMAVTDHAEYMGVMKQMIDPESPLFDLPLALKVRDQDRSVSFAAFSLIGQSISRNMPMDVLMDVDIRKGTWQRIVEAADKHYEPGVFTTFPAYEFTSSPGDSVTMDGYTSTFARNLHRNVIYKGDKVSDLPYSSFDSQNPEDLWDWMDREREKGITMMAIPHNGNMSGGLMYQTTQYNGSPMTLEYINQRMRNEPIQEVVQIKGSSMQHPVLDANDEFADFELFEYTFTVDRMVPSTPEGSYVGEALRNGLELNEQLGGNPYQFGFIGSSDGHNSNSPIEEDNYTGKFGARDGTPEQRLEENGPFLRSKEMSAAGLAGVWAQSNTREEIYRGLENKETFATSGTRMQVRFFGDIGSDFNIDEDEWVSSAYSKGVPMGSDIDGVSEAPSFAIWAIKDPNGANLDRIQVFKAWINNDGEAVEKIIDVAWSDNRKITNGKLEPVKNTVNVNDATYSNSVGAVELKTVWKDPDFNPDQSALYYLRVLEIPTPRWSTYDAAKLKIEPLESLKATIQERAWSSPIWINTNSN